MQLEVQVKEPGNVTSQVNQVSIKFDLYERIKEAQQQGDDGKEGFWRRFKALKLKASPAIKFG